MSLRSEMTLEVMNARGAGRLPALFGFRVLALEQGLLVAEIDIRPELLAPNGFLHAATVVALADTACGYGCIAHLPAQRALSHYSALSLDFPAGEMTDAIRAAGFRPRRTLLWMRA